jgi:hypothetical protein
VVEWSDPSAETEDVSSTASPITTICEYTKAESAAEVSSNAPWLLTNPPKGYNASLFANMDQLELQTSCGTEGGFQCSRFEGIQEIEMMKQSGCTGPAYPAWYHTNGDPITRGIPDSDNSHYLRVSYADPSMLWELKRRIEMRGFMYPVQAMWHLQRFVKGGKRFGFCNTSYPDFPDYEAAYKRSTGTRTTAKNSSSRAPYMASDFGTSTNGGDAGFAGRFYHRVTARLASLNPVGGELVYDGPGLRHAPTNLAESGGDVANTNGVESSDGVQGSKGVMSGVHKSYWEPEAIAMPLYGTDYTKGVLGGSVSLPNPEANGDGVLGGNAPDVGNFHGLHRRILFPDSTFPTTPALLADRLAHRQHSYPPVGNYTRTFAANFISPGSPRSTFVLQNAQRIGCGANAMGVAAAAFISVTERLNTAGQALRQDGERAQEGRPPVLQLFMAHEVPTLLVQWVLARELGTSFTFYSPESYPWGGELSYATPSFAAGQIAGAFAVPRDIVVSKTTLLAAVSRSDLDAMLASYTSGMVNGTIPPSPSPPFECEEKLPNGTWYAYTLDWTLISDKKIVSNGNKEGHSCAAKGALLKQCAQVSTELPPYAIRCIPNGTTIELAKPAMPANITAKLEYWVVTPKTPVEGSSGLASALPVDSDFAPVDAPSTRTSLVQALDAILAGSGSDGKVIKQPLVDPDAAVTLSQLQEIITRHAAVWKSKGAQLDLMQFMGLKPFAFPA